MTGVVGRIPPLNRGTAWPQGVREATALLLKTECHVYGPRLARNMKWAKRVFEKGTSRGIGFNDLRAAIRGLPRCYRVQLPWDPMRVFCRKNHALWLEAMSAGRKLEEREARQIGTAPLIAALERLAREAQG